MPDLRKLSNGRWEARVRTGGADSRRLAKTFNRKADAQRWLTEMRRRQQLGDLVDDERGTQRLDEFIRVYWAVHAVPNLETSTRRNYELVWARHIRPHLGGYRLRDITPKVINRWKATLIGQGVGTATVRRTMVLLQSMLQFAILEEELLLNPVQRVKKPPAGVRREHIPIPILTLERMRDRVEPRDRALLSVLAYAGLRPQEALALRFEDICQRTLAVTRKNVNGRIHDYTKTHTDRYVSLHDPLREDLDDWSRHLGRARGLLFPREDGEPMTATGYRNWRRRHYDPVAAAVGLDDSRPYDLRATWVSLMIFEGHTVIEVARQAGHSAETACATTRGCSRSTTRPTGCRSSSRSAARASSWRRSAATAARTACRGSIDEAGWTLYGRCAREAPPPRSRIWLYSR